MISKHIIYMRFLCCLFFTFFAVVKADAQLNHFIYIQTDNRQAFYVKLNDKLLSSTASGYLIIPKLKDGFYTLNIGFPNDEWPLQQIAVTIDKKDEGFLLKKFDNKGWGLFNIRSLEIIKAVTDLSTVTIKSEQPTDDFSKTLAAVTNNPISMEKPTQAINTPQADSLLKQKIDIKEGIDSLVTSSKVNQEKKNQVIDVARNDDTAAHSPEAILVVEPQKDNTGSGIKQIFSLLDNSGRTILYTITEGLQIDTVRLMIANSEVLATAPDSLKPMPERELEKAETTNLNRIDTTPTISEKPLITDIKVIDVSINPKTQPVITIINGECKSFAGENDFLKLRKKMAAENKEEDMLDVARKGFKIKCYSSSQVKNLGLLFLKEENRYALFDQSYRHISDPENFKALQSQLVTEYYINRFKAMLR